MLLPLFLALSTLTVSASSQDTQAQAHEKIDSLTRSLERKLFPAVEQEAWRRCVRGKRETLAAGRKADKDFAEVDTLLRRAILSRVSQEDTTVQKLLQRKFLLEKGLEDRYNASPEGHGCVEMENGRQRKLDSALTANPDYRRWKRKLEPAESGSGSGAI